MNSTLEAILNSKKLRYEKLAPLLKPYIKQNSKNTIDIIDINKNNSINIFIDIYDIIKPLYNPEIINEYSSLLGSDRFMIASEIINMISHYRHFFFSRLGMYTNFILFYSSEPSSFKISIDKNYKSEFYDKRLNIEHPIFYNLNKIIKDNIKILKTFTIYVPHAYFIDGKDIESSYLPYLIISDNGNDITNIKDKDMDFKDNPSLIISNDIHQYQNISLASNILQLELRGKDKSVIISDINLYDHIINTNSISKNKLDIKYTTDLFPLVYAISGNKNYGVKGITKGKTNIGIMKALKIVNDAIIKGDLSNIRILPDYSNVNNNLLNVSEDLINILNLDSESIIKNLKLLNDDFYEVSLKDLTYIDTQMIDSIDAKSVKYVNEKYFENNPVLLEYCFEGEEYE